MLSSSIRAGFQAKTASYQPSVLVLVKVRNFRYLDPEARLVGGIFAGEAYINAEVEFFELPSKKLLGSRIYGSSTSFSEGIFAATTRKQVQAISEDIVTEIRR